MLLMTHPRTLMRSGVLLVWAVAYCGRFVPEVPRVFSLGALLTIVGVLILAGCYLSRTKDQATASDVNNRSFTFSNGAVFNAALVNISTTLCFTGNAANFTLASAGETAAGNNQFRSCILIVANSTFIIGTGPQWSAEHTLSPCYY